MRNQWYFRVIFYRPRRIRQHEIGDGLSRGRLGRMRGRGWPLLGHHGGPRRERSTEATIALPPSKLSPRASSTVHGRSSSSDQLELDLDEHQLRDGEHSFRWNATWDRDDATHSGWKRSRMGPVSRTVSSTATRKTLQTVGRRIGLLSFMHSSILLPRIFFSIRENFLHGFNIKFPTKLICVSHREMLFFEFFQRRENLSWDLFYDIYDTRRYDTRIVNLKIIYYSTRFVEFFERLFCTMCIYIHMNYCK